MRMTRLCAISLIGVGALVTGAAYANGAPEADQTFITGGLGWYHFDDDQLLHNDGGISAGLGHRWDEWGLEGTFNYVTTDEKHTGNDGNADLDLEQLSVLRFFDAPEGWQPYISFGVNRFGIDRDKHGSDDDAQVHAGLGVFRELIDGWALRADARALYGFDSEVIDGLYTIGLTYAFGGGGHAAAPAPAPAPAPAAAPPKDSDGDGVTDDKDKCPDTKPGALVDEDGCYRKLKETVSIELLLEFDYDKAIVRPADDAQIQKVVDFMKQYPEVSAVLEGHTDARGSTAYNQKLSERRANAVLDYLVSSKGIGRDRLSAIGYGESRLKDPGNTEEAHQRNRRVVAVFQGGTQTREVPAQ